MRKYSLQYIECLTINKSLKKFSNSGACFNQRKQSVAYSERKYQRRIFFKRINSFQQKAPSQMFERFWIYLWCRSLKYCNFETSNLPSPWKMKKRFYILHILNKITLITEIRSTVLHNLFLLDSMIW